jgi:hypothetical protein
MQKSSRTRMQVRQREFLEEIMQHFTTALNLNVPDDAPELVLPQLPDGA